MDSLLVAGMACLACVLGLGGFLGGVWAYACLYRDFKARMEDEQKRRILALELAGRQRDERLRQIQERVRASYGRLEPGQEEVVNEEVERVLGTGPRGNGS